MTNKSDHNSATPAPLTIGVDYRRRNFSEGTGIVRYRDRLRATLGTTGALIHKLLDEKSDLGAEPATISDDIYRKAVLHFRLTRKISHIELNAPVDFFHWSHPMPLAVKDAPNIYTIHDLIPLTHPELTGISSRRFGRLLQRLIDQGAFFTTVSQHVRKEFLHWSGIDEARVICSYQSVEEQTDIAQDVSAYIPYDRYLIMLGRVEARKNTINVIAAWKKAGKPIPLLIAGPQGYWPDKKQQKHFEKMAQDEDVHLLPWLPSEIVMSVLGQADALLMPSYAEGFGLPAIEAMAVGVPSIVSDIPVLSEIAGDAALQIDPDDVDAMSQAIINITHDQNLRSEIITKGRSHVQGFGQSEFAKRLQNAYRSFGFLNRSQ